MDNSCPQCHSKAFKRNGYTRHGKQNHRCLDCGRQFSLEPKVIQHELTNIELIEVMITESKNLEPVLR